MKRILFCIAIATISFTSCQNPSTEVAAVTPTATTKTDSTIVAIADVPKSAKDLIAKSYPGYSIYEVQKEYSYWAWVYKVDIRSSESGKNKIVLLFDVNWTFTGEKK